MLSGCFFLLMIYCSRGWTRVQQLKDRSEPKGDCGIKDRSEAPTRPPYHFNDIPPLPPDLDPYLTRPAPAHLAGEDLGAEGDGTPVLLQGP